jgi:RimJ/RimL family protein N-acetyltransferase
MIIGSRVSLIPLDDACFDLTLRWINDPELRYFTGARFPVSKLEHEKWFREHATDPDNKTYAIKVNDTGALIGLVGNARYDKINRLTDLLAYIGEKSVRGMGYGTEALGLFIDFCFREMNIHKVCGCMYAYNEISKKMCERCGLVVEGVLPEHWYRDGKYHDAYVIGLINPKERREK